MKRLFFTTFLSLFITATAFSQIDFGVRGAFNMAKFTSTLSDSVYKYIPAFDAGVFADIEVPFVKGLYFRPEINYALKGAKHLNNANTMLHYVEIPLSLVYKYELERGFVLAGAGVYYGILIGGTYAGQEKRKADKVQDDGNINNDYLPNKYIKASDLGGKFFAGYEFDNGIGVGLQSVIGFKDLASKFETTSTKISGNYKNFGIGVYITYRINTFSLKGNKYRCGCP